MLNYSYHTGDVLSFPSISDGFSRRRANSAPGEMNPASNASDSSFPPSHGGDDDGDDGKPRAGPPSSNESASIRTPPSVARLNDRYGRQEGRTPCNEQGFKVVDGAK